jgi:hypothetical protein
MAGSCFPVFSDRGSAEPGIPHPAFKKHLAVKPTSMSSDFGSLEELGANCRIRFPMAGLTPNVSVAPNSQICASAAKVWPFRLYYHVFQRETRGYVGCTSPFVNVTRTLCIFPCLKRGRSSTSRNWEDNFLMWLASAGWGGPPVARG